MRGDYLFYEEKIETTPEEKEAKAARRYVAASPWKCTFSRLTCVAARGGRSTPSRRPPLPFAARTDPRSPTVSRSRRTRRTYTHGAESRRASGTSWRTSRYAAARVVMSSTRSLTLRITCRVTTTRACPSSKTTNTSATCAYQRGSSRPRRGTSHDLGAPWTTLTNKSPHTRVGIARTGALPHGPSPLPLPRTDNAARIVHCHPPHHHRRRQLCDHLNIPSGAIDRTTRSACYPVWRPWYRYHILLRPHPRCIPRPQEAYRAATNLSPPRIAARSTASDLRYNGR